MVIGADACGENLDMAVTFLIHFYDICYEIHAVFTSVIKAADEWGNEYISFLGPFCSSIDCSSLFLCEAEGHVGP